MMSSVHPLNCVTDFKPTFDQDRRRQNPRCDFLLQLSHAINFPKILNCLFDSGRNSEHFPLFSYEIAYET